MPPAADSPNSFFILEKGETGVSAFFQCPFITFFFQLSLQWAWKKDASNSLASGVVESLSMPGS